MNASIYQSVNQSVNPSIKYSVSQLINQSINQSINQLIHQSINPSVNQSVSQPINHSINIRSVALDSNSICQICFRIEAGRRCSAWGGAPTPWCRFSKNRSRVFAAKKRKMEIRPANMSPAISPINLFAIRYSCFGLYNVRCPGPAWTYHSQLTLCLCLSSAIERQFSALDRFFPPTGGAPADGMLPFSGTRNLGRRMARAGPYKPPIDISKGCPYRCDSRSALSLRGGSVCVKCRIR